MRYKLCSDQAKCKTSLPIYVLSMITERDCQTLYFVEDWNASHQWRSKRSSQIKRKLNKQRKMKTIQQQRKLNKLEKKSDLTYDI